MKNDLRLAVRMLLQSPAFAIVAILALAIGIGANTAIFSVVNSILLQPLPYPDPSRLVRLHLKFPNGTGNTVSIPKFMAWTRNTQAFQYACLYDFAGPGLNLAGGDAPEQIKGIHVSADFFPVLGVTPIIGRVFSRDEDRPGGPPLAVISNGLWLRRFGGDPSAVGRPLVLNGEPFIIAGVLPLAFRSYPPADVYLPLRADPDSVNQGHYLFAAARLKPGVTLQGAQAQMAVAAEIFRQAHPNAVGKQESATAVPFQQDLTGNARLPLLILLGAVALVLLIACANVANLLLARATRRSREIAIRSAVGASRWRIVRQLLTESLLLSLASAVVGFALGVSGVRALVALSPANLPRAAELSTASALDWRVLAFSIALALLTSLLFGVIPALQISRAGVNATLQESASRSGTGRRNLARNALVVTEVALATVLLIGAALLIRTFASLHAVDPGFNPNGVLTFETSLAGTRYSTTASVDLLTRDLVRRVESIPGVQAAANVPYLPLEGGFGLGFTIVGRPLAAGETSTGGATWMYVSDSYFNVLGIPVLRGRAFNPRDTSASPPVVMVNQAFAKKFWPTSDPLSQRIEIGKGMGPDFAEAPREIVGIVGDVKEGGLENPAPPVMYIPLPQLKNSFMALNNTLTPLTWIVKTSGQPLAFSAAVRKKVSEADSTLAVSRLRAANQVISEATARQDFNMRLLTVFAGIALLLAAIGVYGMLSYSVQQRSREIGIRVALGARPVDVSRMVVSQGMRLSAAGVVLGLIGALLFTRLLTSLLFGVKPYDPLTFLAIAVALTAVAFLACWIPARRATRVDPLIALRYE